MMIVWGEFYDGKMDAEPFIYSSNGRAKRLG